MNIHKHARMTFHGRVLLVRRITVEGWRTADAAGAAGISARTAYKNERLRKAVSDLTLEKLILKEAASGNF